MSKHEVKIIRIQEIFNHPNADKLEIIKVWGYECIVRKGQFKPNDLAAYIESDYVVPLDRVEFSFLSKPGKERKTHRIAVSRLRGVYSQGLLIPCPEGFKEGDNVMEFLGVTRYEPPEEIMVKGAFAEPGPGFHTPRFDLENFKKYYNLLSENEEVIYTVKIHGTSAKFGWINDRMWCGSRTQWKRKPGMFINDKGEEIEVPNNAWWEVLKQNSWIEKWCKTNPGIILYGEVYGGNIQKGFNYGLERDDIGFAVFDILKDGQWINNFDFEVDEFGNSKNPKYNVLKFVPAVYKGPFNRETLEHLAELTESINNCGHIREGIVIKVKNERYDSIGRVALKYVSNRYLET